MNACQDRLNLEQAAQVATLPRAQVAQWIQRSLLCICDEESLGESSLLAILLVKLLQSNHLPFEAIRPMSRFLSAQTREQIDEALRCGRTELLSVGGYVAFVSPASRLVNQTATSQLVISVNIATLMRHARLLLDRYQTGWLLRN